MSYVIHLDCPTCGDRGRTFDPTYNLAAIFHLALSGEDWPAAKPGIGTFEDVVLGGHRKRAAAGLELVVGMSGEASQPMLRAAVERLADPNLADRFRALEPANGWGDLAGARRVIGEMLAAATSCPQSVWAGA
jgi:hypothetical protein